jgi:hypothetical protein
LALIGYLATQMTANSLNVYVSNQILFWFLIAVVISSSRNGGRFRLNERQSTQSF